MPSSIVTIKPPGSLPGISNLAINPITRPNTIHDRIAIVNPPLLAERRSMQSRIHPILQSWAAIQNDLGKATRPGSPGHNLGE
jgi:hypothetical protein